MESLKDALNDVLRYIHDAAMSLFEIVDLGNGM